MKDAKSYGLSTLRGIRSAKSAGKPFYLLINIADPHVPFVGLDRVGREVEDVFPPSRLYAAPEISVPGFLTDDPIVRQELAHYYSSVRRADDAVGQILQALKESGEAENTLVMFLSDHGMPFPFAKTQLYHHSTRTPLIFRWPGIIKADSVNSEHMVSAVDILPTLVEVMGLEIPPGVDGRTFLPLLEGESQGERDRVFKAYNENASGDRNPMRAVQSRQFLFIFNPWSDGRRAMFSATNETATHKRMTELAKDNVQIAGRLNLLKHRVLEEFYDIQKDPNCLVNLIADPVYQQDIEQLRGSLEKWMREIEDPMLAAFLGRQDPKVLAGYMQEQQRATQKRNDWTRAIREKLQKQGNPAKAEM
jgi:N-sulfoglucosamine sulfohydrolase